MKLPRIVPIAVTFALLASGLAVAQGPGRYRSRGGQLENLSRQLDLTDGQKARVKEIFAAHRADGLGAAAQASRQARRTLNQLIHDPAADEGAIRDAAARATQAQGDLAVERHKMFGEIYAILTPEQQAKATQLRQERMNRDVQDAQ
ncbi:MAG TPA: Spy/CpxP family protein refolding chaperone [Candidatus Polarisedimenticolaceae bacterium]|nr:Spy/CpxP family protein refolding chaperone [Candidatus Polarisedimenticolaceae bacterium]